MRRIALSTLSLLIPLAGCGGSGPSGPSATPPVTSAPAPPTSPAATVLRRASIRGVNGHSAMGSARIERDGASHVLHLGDDFRLDSGNTDVYLARNPGRVDGGDLNLGELRSLTGAQSYVMPHDGSQYPHVVLWCRPFRVPIGVGDLQ